MRCLVVYIGKRPELHAVDDSFKGEEWDAGGEGEGAKGKGGACSRLFSLVVLYQSNTTCSSSPSQIILFLLCSLIPRSQVFTSREFVPGLEGRLQKYIVHHPAWFLIMQLCIVTGQTWCSEFSSVGVVWRRVTPSTHLSIPVLMSISAFSEGLVK